MSPTIGLNAWLQEASPPGRPGPPEGYKEFGLSAPDPHICANIVSNHFKGAQLRNQTWIRCCPCLCSCWGPASGAVRKHGAKRTTALHVIEQLILCRLWVSNQGGSPFLCLLCVFVCLCACSSSLALTFEPCQSRFYIDSI